MFKARRVARVQGPYSLRLLLGIALALMPGASQATVFSGSDSAGDGAIDNTSDSLTFNDQSTAGSSTINNEEGQIQFNQQSTAGSSTITSDVAGFIQFNDQSAAGSASITNIDDSVIEFNDQSSAGTATLINEQDGSIEFLGESTAASATIINKEGGYTEFFGTSTAGDALIINEFGGYTAFRDNSTAGNARLLAEAGGYVEFFGTGSASAGSIEGAGDFYLGSVLLTLGSNNLSTLMSGTLHGAGTGSGLIKVGTGTLSLSGDSSDFFDGSIRIEGGLINFSSLDSLGSNLSLITLDGGGLQWAAGNTDDISVRLEPLAAAGGLFDTNGNDVTLASPISGAGGLSKLGAGLLLLGSANSYSGGTRVEAGTLRQGVAGAFVADTAYVVNAGTLDLNNFDLTMSALSGTGGVVALGSAQLTVDQASDSSYAGSIVGAGGLSKQGVGSLTLSGANSYSGGTLLAAGTLRQGAAGAFVGDTAYTITGGTLDLNGFDLSMASLAGTGGGVTLGNAQLTVDQASDSSYAGSITGAGGFSKLGAGLLTLSGANGYSGGTRVEGGTLRQGVAGAFVAATGYTINGGTLDLNGFDLSMSSLSGTGGVLGLGSAQLTLNQAAATTYGGSLTGPGSLIKQGTGSLTLSGANSYSGGTTLDAGSLVQGASGGFVADTAYTINGGTLSLNDFALSMNSLSGTGGVLSLGSAQLTLDQTATTTFAGSLTGTGSLIKQGAGSLTLSGANSYSGGTTLDAGSLVQGAAGAFVGNTAYTINGGTLDLNGFDLSMSSLAGTGGVLSLGSTLLTLNQAGATTFSGSLTGTGSLIKQGAGSLTLSGANSYSGGTTLDAGSLVQGAAGALVGNTAYTLNDGTLNLNDFDLTMSALSGTGGVVALGSAQLTVDQASDSSYAGSIMGAGGLSKSGAGTLNLTGSSTYGGDTLVSAGSLLVNGSLQSSVQVASGGLLGGTGSVGEVLVNAGGILAPGNSIGTLTIAGDLSFDSDAIYQVEVDPSGNTDRLIVSGQASLAGTVQVLAGPGEYGLGTTYTILNSGSPLVGQFDAVTSNLAFLDPSLSYTSNDVLLTLLRNDITFETLAQTPNQRAFAAGASSLPVSNEVFRTLINLSFDQVPDAYNRLSGDAHASVSTALLLDDLGVPWVPLENLNANLANPERALPFWVQVQRGHQRTRDDGNAGLVVLDHDGLLMGSDWPIWGGWRMGVALGYGDQQLGISSRGANADAGTYRSAAYVGNQFPLAPGVLKFSTGLTYSRHQIDGRRSLRLVDGPERLTSRYDMGITQGFSELSLRIGDEQQHYVEPFARLVSLDQRVEGFDERGGSAALSAASQATQVFSSTLGTRGQYKTQWLGRELVLKGSLAVRQLQGDLRPELELRLDEGEPFKVLGTRLPSNSVLLDLHADYAIAPGIGLDIRYKGMSGSGSEGNALAASLRWRF